MGRVTIISVYDHLLLRSVLFRIDGCSINGICTIIYIARSKDCRLTCIFQQRHLGHLRIVDGLADRSCLVHPHCVTKIILLQDYAHLSVDAVVCAVCEHEVAVAATGNLVEAGPGYRFCKCRCPVAIRIDEHMGGTRVLGQRYVSLSH